MHHHDKQHEIGQQFMRARPRRVGAHRERQPCRKRGVHGRGRVRIQAIARRGKPFDKEGRQRQALQQRQPDQRAAQQPEAGCGGAKRQEGRRVRVMAVSFMPLRRDFSEPNQRQRRDDNFHERDGSRHYTAERERHIDQQQRNSNFNQHVIHELHLWVTLAQESCIKTA